MAEQHPTQKRISDRYAGSADYTTRAHYLRRLRLWLFVGVAVASVIATLAYSGLGSQEVYSPGLISQNHSRFANDCQACHLDMSRAPTKLTRLVSFAFVSPGTGSAHGAANSSIAGMDQACLKCHSTAALHLPQAANYGMRSISDELTVVHATNCAVCHREHAGRARISLPSQPSCISCHGNAAALSRSRTTMPLPRAHVAATGENRNVGDGVVRFLTPHLPVDKTPVFTGYAQGHPPFSWERPGVRDPAVLKFNHQRHLRSDIPKVDNHRLTCADCHQPGADGLFMQPIKYEQHCARCHTLKLPPSDLLIPHGDPEKVRFFLASREISFGLAWRAKGITDPAELRRRVDNDLRDLDKHNGLNGKTAVASANAPQTDLLTLERRVFFEGDPPDVQVTRVGVPSMPKVLPPCVKCHTVTEGDAGHSPKVQVPNMAQRWTQHGPFTHRAHEHMQCIECHVAALHSTLTSDILLPPQKLCADCHRPPIMSAATLLEVSSGGLNANSAAEQRAHGGIEWDCTTCHRFHAPPDMEDNLKTLPAGARMPAMPAAGK